MAYEDLASVIDDAVNSDHFGASVLDVGHCIIGDGLSEARYRSPRFRRIRHLHLNDAVNGVEHQGNRHRATLDLRRNGTVDCFGPRNRVLRPFATLGNRCSHPDAEGIILRSREVLEVNVLAMQSPDGSARLPVTAG